MQLSKEKSHLNSTSSLQAKITDFYSVIPIPENKYVLLIEDTVIGVYKFSGIEEAEDYLIYNYYKLKEEAMGDQRK